MNGLVRKEIRSVLPAWALAMVLAIVPVWVVWPGPNAFMLQELGPLVFAPFGLGVLLLSLTPFGQELNWGTFPVLLAQPVSRRRLWLVKTSVVAVALVFAFVAFYVSNHLRVDSQLESMKQTVWRSAFERPGPQTQFFVNQIADTRRAASQDSLLIGGVEVLAAFAGGLWTTLLFRQVTAAFWLTFLAPMGLSVLVGLVLKNFPDSIGRAGLAVVLGVYSGVGFVWAKRFFLRVQDTQWTGGVVSLPSWSELLAGREAAPVRRSAKPIRALVQKEFKAQEVNVILAGGLILVHLAVTAARRWGAEYMATHQSVAMVLEMTPLLSLAMPLLVGSVAVAEERKLGMLQSALCLPTRRGIQFLVKLTIAVTLGMVFGGILPLLIEQLGPPVVAGGAFNGLAFLGGIRPMVLLQLVGALGLTLLAFYGSTLSRNALQGMGAGLLGAVTGGLVIMVAQHAGDSLEFLLWRGPLIGLIGWPVAILVLFALAYRNYGQLQPDLRMWLRNGATLLVTMLCVATVTTILYHRAWEAWLPEEPPHQFTSFGHNLMGNRPVIPGPAGAKHVISGYLGISVQDLTPELAKEFKFDQTAGALVSHVAPGGPADEAGLKDGDLVLRFDGQPMADSKQFADAVARTRPDSTVSIFIARGSSRLTLAVTIGFQPDLRRLARGGRAAAKVVASGSQRAVVLPDGRLWVQQRKMRLVQVRNLKQGMVIWYAGGSKHAGFVPGLDWMDVAITDVGCFAIQSDGSLWGISSSQQGEFKLERVGTDRDWTAISAGQEGVHFSGLKSDGTLWQWGWQSSPTGPNLSKPRQTGADSDWVAVCDYGSKTAAMKTDGSIWRWDWRSGFPAPPQRWLAGACSEPVSFSCSAHVVAAVCADGTLWLGGDLRDSSYARLVSFEEAGRASSEMVRWGHDSDWREIHFVSWGKAEGIKRDGSLWEWNVSRLFGPEVPEWSVLPEMPSRYSDWITACEDNNAFLALARDGSLCLWGEQDYYSIDSWNGLPDEQRLLMPSRIKARRIAQFAR